MKTYQIGVMTQTATIKCKNINHAIAFGVIYWETTAPIAVYNEDQRKENKSFLYPYSKKKLEEIIDSEPVEYWKEIYKSAQDFKEK